MKHCISSKWSSEKAFATMDGCIVALCDFACAGIKPFQEISSLQKLYRDSASNCR